MISRLLIILFILSSLFCSSQVVINEIGVMPQTAGLSAEFQSMYNTTANFGAEFIELYNAGCTSVNIECWSIGGMDGGTNGGVFSFPAGTTIGPHAFLTLGGPIAGGVTFNLSTFIPANGTGQLWGSGAARWHLPNGDGWIILFDNSGSFVDGTYWTFAGNDPGKISTDGTYVSTMTRPTPCGGGTLSDARSNTASMEFVPFTTALGSSFARSSDGGAVWMRDATPTLGATNDVFVACPLPVELSKFSGNCNGKEINLNWTTESEINNDYFEIQYSKDGSDFEKTSEINGIGNSNNKNDYTYIFNNRQFTNGYFRLKQVDFDGEFKYSNIIYVNCNNDEPNVQIINGQLAISNIEKIVSCSIYDATGRIIFNSTDLESFKAKDDNTIYFIQIETINKNYTFRVFNH